MEKDKKTAAELSGKAYTNIIKPEFQWAKWAAPKGDDLADFVNIKLFPYLKNLKRMLLNDKQKEFIEFVLSKYIETGVDELDQEKLPILLTNKYQSLEDAK